MELIGVDRELAEELAALAESEGCELAVLEFKSGTLRVVLDRPDGVTLDHCQRVSRQASPILDAADFGKGRYLLEVSSPGLDRPLYGPRDYERFSGQLAKVTLRDPEDGARKTVIGRLQGFRDGIVTLVEERASKKGPVTGRSFELPLTSIETARLEIEI